MGRALIQHLTSIRTRLTAWYIVILAFILVAFSLAIYNLVAWNLLSGVDENLADRANQLDSVIEIQGNQLFVTRSAITTQRLTTAPVFYRVRGVIGPPVLVSALDENIPESSDIIFRALRGERLYSTIELDEGQQLRMLTAPVKRADRTIGIIEVAQSLGPVGASLDTLRLVLSLGVPLALLVASIGGLFLASRALDPIDRLNRRARTITAQDLKQRLGLPHGNDEVGRLALTLDQMIGRLDDAFQREKQFTADASHELRTPLAIVRSATDLALSRERTSAEYRETIAQVRNEVDRMTRLVSNLLTLARADAEQQHLEFEDLAADELLAGIVESTRPLAEQRQIALEMTELAPVTICGDETRLTQLFLNLIDNAIKYTPAGGQVTVSSRVSGRTLAVQVADTGEGIPEEALPHLFERFYRVDKARSRAAGGAGLGLSIARWVAEAHHGSITVESHLGRGSVFTVRLPLGDSREVLQGQVEGKRRPTASLAYDGDVTAVQLR